MTDESALTRIRSMCLAFDDVEEAVLQDRPLFRVGRRRFAIFNGADSPPRRRWEGAGRSLHVLVDPAEREALRQDVRFTPSPHHGDRGWFGLSLDPLDAVDWREVEELLDAAHALVSRRSF